MMIIASVLAVSCFYWLVDSTHLQMSTFDSQRRGLIRETKMRMQELEPKLQGGCNCGILR